MATKMTFSLDEETASRLRATALRLHKPQSQVVREAIAEYGARVDRLGDAERADMLHALDRYLVTAPSRPAAAVHAERRELRVARRSGGRRRTAL
jgi:predicted transcriptional regulator